MNTDALPPEWHRPPAEFSLAPFWFWNDVLDEAELRRQLDAFQTHGVDAFVIHPRVGLPRDTGWMSQKLLDKMRFAITEAQQRGMWVLLYDEGMYPSGSSAGQVVAENPAYQCRGLVRLNLDTVQPNSSPQGIQIDANGQPVLSGYQSLIAVVPYQGQRYAIIQRPVQAVIRGLHYFHEDGDDPPEDTPLAADLLNPDAVRCFIRLVYQRYFTEFGEHFGTTVRAIFTDEPMLLGRLQEEDAVMPGTGDILQHVNAYLGYDFTPHLPALWDAEAPEQWRYDYARAVENRLDETYYAQLYDWCDTHSIALTGHPAEPDATHHLRYFHIPGQDMVWRQVEPDKPSALEGRQSTQAKAAASAMIHGARRRNANEFGGAYGHELTFDELRWLAHWLLVRGCNLLIPHAFYYSVRGARLHERPPDVGWHSPWWEDGFTAFARSCRRLAWLNTDSDAVCQVAILGWQHHLPWRAAKDCFEHQIDFHYLDVDDLAQCRVTVDNYLQIREQIYRVIVVDSVLPPDVEYRLNTLSAQVTVVQWTDDGASCLQQLRTLIPATPFDALTARALRVRHIRKAGFDWYMLFNEGSAPIILQFSLPTASLLQPETGALSPFTGELVLAGHELRVVVRQYD